MNRVRRQPVRRLSRLPRRGSMALVTMLALLVVTAAVGLVLDRIWLDSARVELTAAAEAAALRAGRLLVTDDLLREKADSAARLQQARDEAARIAAQNQIAGQPVRINPAPGTDIRFGHLVRRERTGETVFLESDRHPWSVVVRAAHSRSRSNPVARLFDGLTSEPAADVAALAEATVTNRIQALEPLSGIPVPALPLAILKSAPEDSPVPTWDRMIEQRQGADRFRFREADGRVSEEPDGIPEITLRSTPRQGDPRAANVHLFVLVPGRPMRDLLRQIETGWTAADLPRTQRHVPLNPLRLDGLTVAGIDSTVARKLTETVGSCRIAFLFDDFSPRTGSGEGRVTCVAAVAIRLLSVTPQRDGSCELIVQPGVLTTPTAVASDFHRPRPDRRSGRLEHTGRTAAETPEHRYIHRLQLTH